MLYLRLLFLQEYCHVTRIYDIYKSDTSNIALRLNLTNLIKIFVVIFLFRNMDYRGSFSN